MKMEQKLHARVDSSGTANIMLSVVGLVASGGVLGSGKSKVDLAPAYSLLDGQRVKERFKYLS